MNKSDHHTLLLNCQKNIKEPHCFKDVKNRDNLILV